MEELYQEKAVDYLISLKMLGEEQFLATHSRPVLLENFRITSSKKKLSQLKTSVGLEKDEDVLKALNLERESFLQARVIPVEKRDPSSPGHMIFVGRSRNNDVVLLNKMVSKLHAYFCQVPGTQAYQVVDMSSTNGTFINGRKLVPSMKERLEDADELSFGLECKLSFFTAEGFCELLQQVA
jgi:hypothetical protein